MKTSVCCLVLAVLSSLIASGCQQAANRAGSIASSMPFFGNQDQDLNTRASIARVMEQQGNLREAEEKFTQLQKDAAENPVMPHRLGIIASRNGDYEAATINFKRSLELDPHNAEVLADWGYSLFLQGKLDDAEAVLRRASNESTNDPRIMNNLAIVLGHAGRTEESLALFRQVNGEAAGWLNLGYVHANRGEGGKAAACFSRALSLDNQLEPAAYALVQIAELEQQAERRSDQQTLTAAKTVAPPSANVDVVNASHEQILKTPAHAAVEMTHASFRAQSSLDTSVSSARSTAPMQ